MTFPYFDIKGNDGSVYIRRHKLFRCRFFHVYLHHILRSDQDRCLHDHPWRFVTLVLAGGYREILKGGIAKWRSPGTILYRPATFAHRIEVDHPAWSLVVVGPRQRDWGFFTINGWRKFIVGNDSPVCEAGALLPSFPDGRDQ